MKGITPPTRREVVLVSALLVVLICFTQAEYISTATSSLRVSTGMWKSVKEVFKPQMSLKYPEPRLQWTDNVPETSMPAHVPGWTIYDRAYLYNGTFYIVTSTPERFPRREEVISNGNPIFNGEEEIRGRLPSDNDMLTISPEQAASLFNTSHATQLSGASFVISDNKQFLTHYYHFAAELMFGLWRTYSSLDPFITPEGRTTLPPPRRMMFIHVPCEKWRDYANMNQYLVRGAFPSIGMEFEEDWQDRQKLARPFVFERVLIADRSAAMKGPFFPQTFRTASEPFALHGSVNWWSPVRNNVLEFAGLAPEWVLGPDPGTLADRQKYVITYISRQEWGRRMLRPADHDKLVSELNKLRDTYGYEVNVVSMDKLSRSEQFQLAGRTTIMMGVHGNGLTSLIWMRPTPRSTVIEFFFPEGIAFDYEWTTRALGMTHYGVWNNVTFTRPNVPQHQKYPEGFQGNDIPLNGEVVAKLVHQRLSLSQGEEDGDMM